MALSCLIRALLRNLIFLIPAFCIIFTTGRWCLLIPTWDVCYDLELDTLLLTAKGVVRAYIFFQHHVDVSRMSQHFNPTNLYPNIVMTEVHLPIFERYIDTTSEESK